MNRGSSQDQWTSLVSSARGSTGRWSEVTHPLLLRLRELALPDGDYAVFGSGPLLVRGVITDAGDLDVLVRGAAWSAARRHGSITHLERYGLDVIDAGGGITLGREWAIGHFDVHELIDTAEVIDGLPFVLLRHVVAYKRVADRPKDRRHLAALATAGLID